MIALPSAKSLTNLALALAGGIAMRFAFGLEPVWWLAWLAPVPLLVAALRSGRLEAVVLVSLAGLLAASANFHFYQAVMGLPGAVLVTSLQALAWLLIVCLSRRIMLGWPGALGVLAYPLLWAAFDTLTAHLLPDGNWGSIGYSQSSYLPAVQVVSLAGMPGLVFILSLLPAALALLAVRGTRDRAAWGSLAAATLLAGSTLVYGHARLAAPAAPGMVVGLAAIDDFIGPRTKRQAAEQVWARYDGQIAELARQGAKLVVLPEKIAVLDPKAALQIQQRWAAAAASARVWLMAGIGIDDGARRENIAWLFTPSGELGARYQKHHMAPPEREFAEGRDFAVRVAGQQAFGLAICKDMHFAEMGRQYARRGANVLLVPAWDFGEDGRYAARLSALRGVESGFAMVRSAREGLLTVTDPLGRIVAESAAAPMPGVTLIASLPRSQPAPTLYAKVGDVFGWLCVALGACMLVYRRRPRPAQD